MEPYAGAAAAKAVARRLIRHFGSLRTIWSASSEALREALAPGEAVQVGAALAAARHFAEAAAREVLAGQPVDTRAPEFRNYLVRRLGVRREECVMILFFTATGLFIAEHFHDDGRSDEVRIPLRRTVRRAFDLDARRLVIAHNHPSGITTPSEADIVATTRLRGVLHALEIALEDHCIVARNSVASMRAMGLL